MKLINKKRIMPFIFIILLTGGVLFLVIMQITWAGQAVTARKEEIKRNLMLNVNGALTKMQDDIDVIFSMLYIEPDDFRAGNWDSFYTNVEFLKTNTAFFEYAGKIYYLPSDKKEATLVFSHEEGMFLPGEVPENLQAFRSLADQEPALDFFRNDTGISYHFIPLHSEEPENREQFQPAQIDALLVIEMNSFGFYTSQLSTHLSDILEEYSFRITDNTKRYYSSPSLRQTDNRKPDFRVPLSFAMFQWFGLQPPPGDREPLSTAKEVFSWRNPLGLRFILKRHLDENRDDNFFRERGKDGLVLEIFYPGGPFEKIAARQTAVSLVISITILAALVISLLFLYRLYARIKDLRGREQEFIATISHELRTPLAVIQSTSDNLSSGIIHKEEKVRKYGHVIRKQAKRLSLMLENILKYAGLDGGNGRLKNQDTWINLHPFITGLLEPSRELAEKKGAEVIFKKDSYKGRIKTDPVALGLVLENLLINAVHHGIDPRKAQNQIRLLIRKHVPGGISFIIEDDGPGIPAREKRKVFKPFFRGEQSSKAQVPGSGLGLHLVKRITELLGGSVNLESPYLCVDGHQQQGCRFTVRFPFEVNDGQKG